MKNKIKNKLKEYDLLLKSVPSWCTIVFILSVVLMNLLACKLMFQYGWLAADCGVLVSFFPFLVMDGVTKVFGPKAATKLNIVGLFANLFCIAMLAIGAAIPQSGYDEFNYIFGANGSWFIWVASSTAFIVSGVINNFLNWEVGKLFKNNPDSKTAYFTRTYISTFVGQFADNVIFATIAYWIFGNYFWGGAFFTGGVDFYYPFVQCVGAGVLGALVELLMEVIFSPLGYKLVMKWQQEGIADKFLAEYPQEL